MVAAHRGWHNVLPGPLIASVACATYLVGAERALTFDGALTAASFILTDSLSDSVTSQVDLNNHPLFSALEQVIVRLSGSSSEVTLRLLPAVLGAVAVFGLHRWVADHHGPLAGAAAAVFLAFHPLMLQQARVVRGYTLLVLLAVVSTRLLVDRRAGPLYAAAVAAGVATHLYMVLVLVIHLVGIALDPSRRRSIVWLALGVSAGAVIYVPLVATMLEFGDARGRAIRPVFPLDLAWELLGRHGAAVGATAVLVLAGWLRVRQHPMTGPLALAAIVVVLLPWVVAPLDLYVRFFIWLVPVIGFLVAAAVAADRRWAALVVVLPVLWLLSVESWTADTHSNRVGGRMVAALGTEPCLAGWTGMAAALYAPGAQIVHRPPELRECDAVLFTDVDEHPALYARARTRFDCRSTATGPLVPGVVFHQCEPPGTDAGQGDPAPFRSGDQE